VQGERVYMLLHIIYTLETGEEVWYHAVGILWWYSERFVVITRQLQAAKCSLSQRFGHIFTLLENLRFPYCCTQCQQTLVRLVCYSLGPCIKNILFNFR
jgi:hypothetical protein